MFLILYGQLAMIDTAESILQPSLGILMHPTGTINLQDETYAYTVLIPWPQAIEINNLTSADLHCEHFLHNKTLKTDPLYKHCILLVKILDRMNEDVNAINHKVDKLRANIAKMLPKFEHRSRRAFDMLTGAFAGTVADYVTMKHLQSLEKHVSYLYQNQDLIAKKFHSFGDDVSGFMNLVDSQLHNYSVAFVDQNAELASHVNAIVKVLDDDIHGYISNNILYRQFQADLSFTMLLALNYLTSLSRLTGHANTVLANWEHGIDTLSRQQLPVSILPADMLEEAINHVSSTLLHKNPNLSLVYLEPTFYYDLQVVPAYTEDCLAISIHMPLIQSNTSLGLYSVYQVILHQVANPDNHSATILDKQFIPDIYAVSFDHKFSISMDLSTWHNCHGHRIKYCSAPLSIDILTPDTCIDSLYLQQLDAIMHHCNFHVVPLPSKPVFMKYGTKALVSGVAGNSTLICPSLNTSLSDTCIGRVCLISIPCRCHLLAGSHFLRGNMLSCHANLSSVKFYFAENLAFLSTYFTPLAIPSGWHTDSLFHSSLLPHLPQIPHSFLSSFRSSLQTMDSTFHHNLSLLMQKVKQDTTVPLYLPNRILPSRGSADLLSILALILGFCASALSLYLLCRFHKLCGFLHGGGGALAIEILHDIPWTASSTTSGPSEAASHEHTFHISYSALIAILLICCMVFLLLVVYYLRLKALQQVKIALLVLNSEQKVLVNLFALPCNLNALHVLGSDVVKKLKAGGTHLKVTWGDIELSINNINIMLPDMYHLNPWTVHKLKNITAKPYATLVIVRYGHLMVRNVGFIGKFNPPDISTGPGLVYHGSNFISPLQRLRSTRQTRQTRSHSHQPIDPDPSTST